MRIGVRAVASAKEIWDYLIPATPVSGSYGEELKKLTQMDAYTGRVFDSVAHLAASAKLFVGWEGATPIADKLTLTRAGYLDNLPRLDVNVSTRLGNYEMYSEGALAAGASYTPTAAGLFTLGCSYNDLFIDYYCPTALAWVMCHVATYGRGIGGLIGDGANLRLYNSAAVDRYYVLMRAY